MAATYLFARMPIVHTQDQVPFGVEILLRDWHGIPLSVFNHHPKLYSDFAYDIWQAIYQLDSTGQCRVDGQRLFINLTIPQLLSEGSFQFLKELDQQCRLFANVVIELTEHAFEDVPQGLHERILLFKRFGCQFAIDDFGCQSSNIQRVFALMPDYIKIDRALVTSAAVEYQKHRLITQLVKFCHDLDKQVILEGIEMQADNEMAKQCKADFCQGFYYGKPELINRS